MNLTSLFGKGGAPGQIDPRAYIDPTVTMGMTGAIDQYRNLLGDIGGAQGGYVQSVVDPTIASNAQAYGALREQQAQRGIEGSSFADQSTGALIEQANRNVEDARSRALQQSYGMQSNLIGDILGGYGALGGYESGIIGRNMGYNIDAAGLQARNQLANAGLFGQLMGGIRGAMGPSGG